MTGQIHNSKSLFLREAVGTATDPEAKIKYEMTTINDNRQPMVCSSKTGKYFTLSWEDIVNLAVEAGIDKDDT